MATPGTAPKLPLAAQQFAVLRKFLDESKYPGRGDRLQWMEWRPLKECVAKINRRAREVMAQLANERDQTEETSSTRSRVVSAHMLLKNIVELNTFVAFITEDNFIANLHTGPKDDKQPRNIVHERTLNLLLKWAALVKENADRLDKIQGLTDTQGALAGDVQKEINDCVKLVQIICTFVIGTWDNPDGKKYDSLQAGMFKSMAHLRRSEYVSHGL